MGDSSPKKMENSLVESSTEWLSGAERGTLSDRPESASVSSERRTVDLRESQGVKLWFEENVC